MSVGLPCPDVSPAYSVSCAGFGNRIERAPPNEARVTLDCTVSLSDARTVADDLQVRCQWPLPSLNDGKPRHDQS